MHKYTIHHTSYIIHVLLALVLIVHTSCEVIPESEQLIPVSVTDTSACRHVLLEFTGFRCVNCPAAAETAANLQHIYGDSLILIALHPASNPFTQGAYDYTCPEADSIYQLLGGLPTTPFPTGSIDMRCFDDNYFIAPADWPTKLMNINQRPTIGSVPQTTSYWLVEDSVLGVQAMPDGTVNTAYYHRHVLRAISPEPFLSIPDKCDPAHCSVVTIYSDSDKQIIDAYETSWTTPTTAP